MTETAPGGPPSARREPALTLVAGGGECAPVPCAARPSTGFVHLDGACHCFAGGPAPEFAPTLRPAVRDHLAVTP